MATVKRQWIFESRDEKLAKSLCYGLGDYYDDLLFEVILDGDKGTWKVFQLGDIDPDRLKELTYFAVGYHRALKTHCSL